MITDVDGIGLVIETGSRLKSMNERHHVDSVYLGAKLIGTVRVWHRKRGFAQQTVLLDGRTAPNRDLRWLMLHNLNQVEKHVAGGSANPEAFLGSPTCEALARWAAAKEVA